MVLKLTPPLVNPNPQRCLAFGCFFNGKNVFMVFFLNGGKKWIIFINGKNAAGIALLACEKGQVLRNVCG